MLKKFFWKVFCSLIFINNANLSKVKQFLFSILKMQYFLVEGEIKKLGGRSLALLVSYQLPFCYSGRQSRFLYNDKIYNSIYTWFHFYLILLMLYSRGAKLRSLFLIPSSNKKCFKLYNIHGILNKFSHKNIFFTCKNVN